MHGSRNMKGPLLGLASAAAAAIFPVQRGREEKWIPGQSRFPSSFLAAAALPARSVPFKGDEEGLLLVVVYTAYR